LVITVLLLIGLGLVIIYSATFRDEGFAAVRRQMFAFFVGLLLSFGLLNIDYKRFCTFRISLSRRSAVGIQLSYVIYLAAVFLLVLVMKKGQSALGAQRWIRLGPFGTFEPSEFAKLAVLLALATYFSERKSPLEWKSIAGALVLTGVPLLLVLVQPDLGTSIVLAGILFMLLFYLGVNWMLLSGSVLAAGAAVLKIMKPYQRERLLVFLHPKRDPTGSGWNILQSLIAVGSGRFSGKGLLAGTQTQLKFVPEHSTDFIFTVIAEELGFIGSAAVLFLYGLILWVGSRIVFETEDPLGKLLAVGIVTMLFVHVFINIGMTVGVMPITGIPLPFISAGGSSLITNMLAIAFLLNIESRRGRLISA